MKATITVEMDNAAFGHHGGHELSRILKQLADTVRTGSKVVEGDHVKLRDVYGNTVGSYEVSE